MLPCFLICYRDAAAMVCSSASTSDTGWTTLRVHQRPRYPSPRYEQCNTLPDLHRYWSYLDHSSAIRFFLLPQLLPGPSGGSPSDSNFIIIVWYATPHLKDFPYICRCSMEQLNCTHLFLLPPCQCHCLPRFSQGMDSSKANLPSSTEFST